MYEWWDGQDSWSIVKDCEALRLSPFALKLKSEWLSLQQRAVVKTCSSNMLQTLVRSEALLSRPPCALKIRPHPLLLEIHGLS